jgi:hypothetical protein
MFNWHCQAFGGVDCWFCRGSFLLKRNTPDADYYGQVRRFAGF